MIDTKEKLIDLIEYIDKLIKMGWGRAAITIYNN
jgi:hypothetical protein